MKFLCVACDEAMRLVSTEGPEEGSLTVTFACPACAHRVAMLTNPWETQLVRTLGVRVGGRAAPAAPFAEVRAGLARQRAEAFADGMPAAESTGVAPSGEAPGCPFAAMIPDYGAAGQVAERRLVWTPEAEGRLERIPAFIRPMAKQAIERFAQERGYGSISDEVMDEARAFIGM